MALINPPSALATPLLNLRNGIACAKTQVRRTFARAACSNYIACLLCPSRYLPPTTVPNFATKAQTFASNPAVPDENRYPQERFFPSDLCTHDSATTLQPFSPGIPTTPVPFFSTQVPSSSTIPRPYTRERLQAPLGTDHHSCAISAGFSDASIYSTGASSNSIASWDGSAITCSFYVCLSCGGYAHLSEVSSSTNFSAMAIWQWRMISSR